MAKVKDFSWAVEIDLTRKQIVSLGKIAAYIANIEADYKKAFPSGTRDIHWESIKEAFREFSRAYKIDQAVYKELCKIVSKENSVYTEEEHETPSGT